MCVFGIRIIWENYSKHRWLCFIPLGPESASSEWFLSICMLSKYPSYTNAQPILSTIALVLVSHIVGIMYLKNDLMGIGWCDSWLMVIQCIQKSLVQFPVEQADQYFSLSLSLSSIKHILKKNYLMDKWRKLKMLV